MDDLSPPAELTSRKLRIRHTNGRLILATPVLRHPWLGGLCILLPLVFWAIQIPKRGNAFALVSAPLPMHLIAAVFVLLGIVILFHGLRTIVDQSGVTTVHSLLCVPYYRALIPAHDLISFSLSTNGSMSRADGGIDHLYCIIANSSAPPRISVLGFSLKPGMAAKEVWQEWLAFSLPGESAGDYVLALVQAACPLPAADSNRG